MEFVVTIAVSVAASVLAFVVQGLLKENRRLRDRRRKENEQREDGIAEGVKVLLRTQMFELHDAYVTRGNIPNTAYENFSDMYTAYHNLGGNGTATHLKKDIDKLPMSKANF